MLYNIYVSSYSICLMQNPRVCMDLRGILKHKFAYDVTKVLQAYISITMYSLHYQQLLYHIIVYEKEENERKKTFSWNHNSLNQYGKRNLIPKSM